MATNSHPVLDTTPGELQGVESGGEEPSVNEGITPINEPHTESHSGERYEELLMGVIRYTNAAPHHDEYVSVLLESSHVNTSYVVHAHVHVHFYT